eukprot:scaffold22382_cov115-Isochrysis_galbana.AAC.1
MEKTADATEQQRRTRRQPSRQILFLLLLFAPRKGPSTTDTEVSVLISVPTKHPGRAQGAKGAADPRALSAPQPAGGVAAAGDDGLS